MTIYQGKALTETDLFRYILMPGEVFTNVFSITWEIIEDPSGTPSVIEGPTSAVNFETGKYYSNWIVPEAIDITKEYQVFWRWKLNASSVEQTATEDFLITSPTSSSVILPDAVETYITPAEAIEAIPQKDRQPTEEEALPVILFLQEYIEKITNQFFNRRDTTLSLNGSGNSLLVMPYPIIDISKIEVKNSPSSFIEYDLGNFEVFNRFVPDDREYPKIKIISNNFSVSSVYPGFSLSVFPRGSKNIRLTGRFGYVTPDLETPEPIKKVMKILFYQWYNGVFQAKGQIRKAKIYESEREKRDIKTPEEFAVGSLTGDPEIDNILRFYTKAPSAVIF